MKYTIDHTELSRMLERAATQGASRALEEAGLTKKTITRKQIKDTYGEHTAILARNSPLINWIVMGSGKRDRLMCLKSEFDKFITTNKIEALEKPTKRKPRCYAVPNM